MEALDESKQIAEITDKFQALSSLVPLCVIHDEAGYARAVSVLNSLLDAGGADEKHDLADLVHMVGLLIAEYEALHF